MSTPNILAMSHLLPDTRDPGDSTGQLVESVETGHGRKESGSLTIFHKLPLSTLDVVHHVFSVSKAGWSVRDSREAEWTSGSKLTRDLRVGVYSLDHLALLAHHGGELTEYRAQLRNGLFYCFDRLPSLLDVRVLRLGLLHHEELLVSNGV